MNSCRVCRRKDIDGVEFYLDPSRGSGLSSRCKDCTRKWAAEDYKTNRPCRLERMKIRRKTKAPEMAEYWKRYRALNREELNSNHKARGQNPHIHFMRAMRTRLSMAIRQGGGKKSYKTAQLLGMELPEFRVYLRGQFRDGMTWENYGSVWSLDHIRPCVSFDLADPEQQKVCFRWDNLQPLLVAENQSKGSKWD